MNFDFENYVVPPLKGLAVLLLGTVIAGTLFLQFFPTVFGELASALLGSLAPFFAAHATVYQLVQTGLLGVYTILVMAGIDLIFLFLLYNLLDKILTRKGSWSGLLFVGVRAVYALLGWQVIIGIAICVGFFWLDTFSSLWLVPPFLTDHIWGSVYMMLWEISLIVGGLGFAFTETRIGVLQGGRTFLLEYLPLWMIVGSIGVLVTWFPAMLIGESVPSWILLLWGLINHTLLFMFVLIFLFNQRGISSYTQPETSTPVNQ
jgi:hypothetical protein